MNPSFRSDHASVRWVCFRVLLHLLILYSASVSLLYFEIHGLYGIVKTFFIGVTFIYIFFAYMQLSSPMFEVNSDRFFYRNFFRFGVQEFLLADVKEVSIEGNTVKATIKGKIVSMQFPESIRESVVRMLEKVFQITLSG